MRGGATVKVYSDDPEAIVLDRTGNQVEMHPDRAIVEPGWVRFELGHKLEEVCIPRERVINVHDNIIEPESRRYTE